MTKFNVAYLSCRILALYSIFHGLGRIDYAAGWVATLLSTETWGNATYGLMAVLGILPFLVYLSIGIGLWVWARPIAARIFPPEEETGKKSDLDPYVLRELAFSVIGVFLVVTALSDGSQIAANWVLLADIPSAVRDRNEAVIIARLIRIAVMLALGVWLTLGSRGIAAWIDRLRRPAGEFHNAEQGLDAPID